MAKSFLEKLKNRLGGSSPIKIGVVTTRTGPLDYYGTMQVRGLELGIEYATQGSHQVAGRPIELIIEDDAGDTATAARKARELIEERAQTLGIQARHRDSSVAGGARVPGHRVSLAVRRC